LHIIYIITHAEKLIKDNLEMQTIRNTSTPQQS